MKNNYYSKKGMKIIYALLLLMQFYVLTVGAFNTDRWMEQLSHKLNNVRYSEIKIPATHNSGSWNISMSSPYSYDTNLDPSFQLIPQLVYIFGLYGVNQSLVKRWINPWMKNQQYNIMQQLDDGIRHFDIRVCKSSSGPVVCHALESITVESVFKDISTFLKKRKGEIVSVDVNHIYGLTTSEHLALVSNINTILGNDTMVDPSFRSFNNTYRDLINVGERVFVFYADNGIVNNYGKQLRLFSSATLPTPWVNVVSMDALKSGIISGLNSRSDFTRGYVSQVLLTPSLNMMVSGLFDPPSSVKQLAKMNYGVIPDWIRYDFPKHKVNIINTDFYTSKFVRYILNLNL